MKLPPAARPLWWLLIAATVLVALLSCGIWVRPAVEISRTGALLGLVAWVTLTVSGWLLLRSDKAEAQATKRGVLTLQQEAERMQTRLTEVANSQGRFVGNIAHEIKTPLAISLVEVDLLRRCSHDPAAVVVHAGNVAERIHHLADLVDSFLRLARPFAQSDTSHHEPTDVHDFVVAAVQRSQRLARAAGVRLIVKLAETTNDDAAIEVLGDAVLLEAILENLIRNAVRFTPRDSSVEVAVQHHGETISLCIRDHGAGIAAAQVEAVFDWFFRSPELTLPSSGTGFGLAIAKRIAEHHAGNIVLRNLPSGGCEFEIMLPRWLEDQHLPLNEHPGPAGVTARY